jgi:hypothetical protein
MIHFVYPNTKGKQFIGCGRFIVFVAGEQPEEHYEVADPECSTRADVIDAASILAPEPVHPHRIVYEKKDDPQQHYIGSSLCLAYLFALISRTRAIRADIADTDIWCTGCVELAGEQPILKSVISSGFEPKLNAFLSNENTDRLFIVPEANIDQLTHLYLNQRKDVHVFSLKSFPRGSLLGRKTILKVRRNELQALVDTLFEQIMPSHIDSRHEAQEKSGKSYEDESPHEQPQSQQPRPRHRDTKKRRSPQKNHSLTRQEALEELRRYGIEGSQVYLIDLIPLIEILWADGQAQTGEIIILSEYIPRHVEQVNRMAGYEVLTLESARAFVRQFLQERPTPDLLRSLRSLIAPIRLSGSDTETNKALQESLLAACLDIASSSVTEYPYKHHDRFNLEEKRCFFEILESLEQC